MLVKECMTKDPITISLKEDVQYGFYLLKKHNIRQLPVTNNGYILGIVTERDLRMLIEKEYGIKIESAMSTNLKTISQDKSIETAAQIIHDNKFNALPVVDGKDMLVGIITVTDVLQGLLKVLEDKKQNKINPELPDENYD
ncbi:MAG: CBS domain-containing protein [Candidatus Dadabacteria bacterium]|nr:CBS domain-containing protein [Candidatus Dadabacteria bacterium]NIT13930.1 CBS domain-containing protein [Candidatus Dadabacteria bacterium]